MALSTWSSRCFLPTYSQIARGPAWWWWPAAAHGISTGWRPPLSTAYAAELAPAGHDGRWGCGVISMFVNVGLLAQRCHSRQRGCWATRPVQWVAAAVRVRALLGLVTLYLRRSLPEDAAQVGRVLVQVPAVSSCRRRVSGSAVSPAIDRQVWRMVRGLGGRARHDLCRRRRACRSTTGVHVRSARLARGGFRENAPRVFGLTTLLGVCARARLACWSAGGRTGNGCPGCSSSGGAATLAVVPDAGLHRPGSARWLWCCCRRRGADPNMTL